MGPHHQAVVMKCDGQHLFTTTVEKRALVALSIQYMIRMGFNSKHRETDLTIDWPFSLYSLFPPSPAAACWKCKPLSETREDTYIRNVGRILLDSLL